MSSQIGRNDPCPCGSGKKYKNCCYKRGVLVSKKGQNKVALGVVAVVAVIAGIVSISKLSSSPTSQSSAPIVQPPISSSATATPTQNPLTSSPVTGAPFTAQPPGPAPAGKVWSAEHGHWHDAPVNSTATSNANRLSTSSTSTAATGSPVFDILPEGLNSSTQSQGKTTPQPPGPVPAGKVWSAEHGHWHDVSQGGQPANLTSQPPGPAPAGKVWSAEHGHWHDAPAEAKTIQVTPTNTDPK